MEQRKAVGIARFPPDPLHFPDEPIVRNADLLQACFEIGELLVVKSLSQKNREKRFKVGKAEICQRLSVPQGQDLYLEASFEGVSQRKITVKGKIGKKIVIECQFVYKLKEVKC